MPDTPLAQLLQELLQEMLQLRNNLGDNIARRAPDLSRIHPNFRRSAHNLLAYLTLRQWDLRPLQAQLGRQGLSSLGQLESHVIAAIEALTRLLSQLQGVPYTPSPLAQQSPAFDEGETLLAQHVLQLLGSRNSDCGAHLMVTMPGEAAHNYALVEQLLQNGMDCMRINCAHDSPRQWQAMIDNLRRAEQTLGLSCKVSMDLGGPKLRTLLADGGASAIKLKPQRDHLGQVTGAARLLFSTDPNASAGDCSHTLLLPAEQLQRLRSGDELLFTDCRGARRQLTIVERCPQGVIAETTRTAYLNASTAFKWRRRQKKLGTVSGLQLPAAEHYLLVVPGQHLWLCQQPASGADDQLGCSLPEVLAQVQVGEHIWFDDGKIGGIADACEAGRVRIRIIHADPAGSKLRAEKGINLPDTQLQLPALTGKDLEDLQFVAAHADLVALSFANRVEDVRAIATQLRQLGREEMGILLKIETPLGFHNLPGMLLEAMTMASCGVMIARGDLAIEVGFERLAEVQEEILWICEAAHVPVVWATQVLDTMARSGAPTRAEISDAALAHRAECVMLNKGEHIAEALATLRNILLRMETHEHKKHARLRPLGVVGSLFASTEDAPGVDATAPLP